MSLTKIVFILLIALFPTLADAQILGCMDTIATNYNPAATISNGTCTYPYTTATPLIRATLCSALNETSGLLIHQGKLYTNTDSGTPNSFFQIDTLTGDTLQRIQITNATNYDWEEISEDSNAIYVGDFGNNAGNRTNLKILKIFWSQIGTNIYESDTAQFITYHYPDQSDFTLHTNANSWDCEAMLTAGDSIYLFTKDWVHGFSKLYSLPKIPGDYAATLLDSFNAGGLITGASFDSSKHKIVLVGYTTSGQSFLWQLTDFTGNQFLKGNKRKIELGYAGQTEGVAILDNNRILLSNEQFLTVPPRLQLVDTRSWNVATGFWPGKKKIISTHSFYPNPCSVFFNISNCEASSPSSSCWVKLYNKSGQAVSKQKGCEINTSHLSPGIYTVELNGEIIGTVTVLRDN